MRHFFSSQCVRQIGLRRLIQIFHIGGKEFRTLTRCHVTGIYIQKCSKYLARKKVALATANFATKRSFCEENATAAKGPCCSCILEQCNLTNLQWHTYFASPPAFSKRGFYYPASKSFWPDELTLVSHVLRRKENSNR